MAKKSNTITVNDKPIVVIQGQDKQSYICLTEMRNQQLKVLQQANADFNFKKLSDNDPKLIEG